MDRQFERDLAHLPEYSLRLVIETAMRSFVAVYRLRPAFVEIWLRGRTTTAIRRQGPEHNVRITLRGRAFVNELGLLQPTISIHVGLLAVEIADRGFQLAFEHDLQRDGTLIAEAIVLVTSYLECDVVV